jgi:phosphopantothenoylcysteine decarboxylase/phosphopantothenate--cysteine ligase
MFENKNVLIGISGGIAAYKSVELIRLFKKAGANVKVVTTENALQFITELTLETISQNKVYSSVFSATNDYSTEHISLTDWADFMIVAPATANIIGKFANGIADDALSTTFMAFNKQVFIAPAMNNKMYSNFAFVRNINYLKSNGIEIIEPETGFLACGYEAKGRMEEPSNIYKIVEKFFNTHNSFKGKKVLVTAGPTYEAIDPVRFIGNHSSGKMGFAIAESFANRGADVTLISGPVALSVKHNNIKLVNVVSANDMLEKCSEFFDDADITVMAAAVADYTLKNTYSQKIKKNDNLITLELTPTVDILKTLSKLKKENQLIVGFALETENENYNAKKKLKEKNLDLIVLNSLNDDGAGFGCDTNKITIIDKNGNQINYETENKKVVAERIVDYIWTLVDNN